MRRVLRIVIKSAEMSQPMDRVTVMPQTPIDYAPALPIYRRRRVLRLVIPVAVILFLAFVAITYGPDVWRHAALLYWQDKAMTYSPPPDQVVFDNGPHAFAGATPSRDIVSLPNSEGRSALPATRFITLLSPRHPTATLFLHERKNSLRQSRLVYVMGHGVFPVRAGQLSDSDTELMIDALVYQPGSAFKEALEMNVQQPFLDVQVRAAGKPVRLFAGQVETDDPSHFSILCEIGDKRSIIDGWLMDNDTLKLEKRR